MNKDVEEMNEKLIENWNRVVSEGDTVFHLGDFALTMEQCYPSSKWTNLPYLGKP